MINDYNLEYTDIIQYLNQIVIKKSERLNIVFKAKDIDNSDYNICKDILDKIINYINEQITNNHFNQLSTNISSFDGFEKVRKELGLPIGLYKKNDYTKPINLVKFLIIHSYYTESTNRKCFLYKIRVIINRSTDSFLDFDIDTVIIENNYLVYNVFINRIFKKDNNNLYYSHNKNIYHSLSNDLSMNINLYNEIQKQRDKQNIIMQSSINDFY